MKKRRKGKKEVYIYYLNKHKEGALLFFFSSEKEVRRGESSQGVGSDGCREGEVRSSGLGVSTSATSHCEIAGAHNCLVVYVIFLRKKQNNSI